MEELTGGWIYVTNSTRTVYGTVSGETFYKWKWIAINRDPKIKPPKVVTTEKITTHEIKADFWTKFEVISSSEWNELWIRDYINT